MASERDSGFAAAASFDLEAKDSVVCNGVWVTYYGGSSNEVAVVVSEGFIVVTSLDSFVA